MHNRTIKKSLVVGIIVLFIGVSVTPSTGKIATSKTNINEGSLLGYINDTSGNPIEGALIRVYFHETYEEDYSDSTGFYHVTNIPICYCLKNATCSKECYTTEWVLLSIVENTTHDFILNTTNHPPKAPKITRPGSYPSESIKVIVKNPAKYPPGKPIEFRFEAIDPDGDDIRYHIDWGDGYNEITGFYPSGEEVKVNHTYNCQGTYTVSARAEDTCGFIGPWGTMSIPIWSVSTEENNDLVEIDVQLFKPNSVEDYKMYITQEQDEKLNKLFENFKQDLENSESYGESVRMYNDMVVSIDELGLLPTGTTVEEVQRLITGKSYRHSKLFSLLERLFKSYETSDAELHKQNRGTIYENRFCLLSSTSSYTEINIAMEDLLLAFINDFIWLLGIDFDIGHVYYGYSFNHKYPSRGWINTDGLIGKWTFEGDFHGDLGQFPKLASTYGSNYRGAKFFRGIITGNKCIGRASHVKIEIGNP